MGGWDCNIDRPQVLRLRNMARRRRLKNYKVTNAMTKNVGSTGDQIHVGKISKIQAQGITAWANNCLVSIMSSEIQRAADDDYVDYQPAYMVYATTSSTWSDDNIICARAGFAGDTINIPLKRPIRQDVEDTDSNDGVIHLWVEASDVALVLEYLKVRLVFETWGRYIEFTEDTS